MKIAVASSGLGHVARGIETWAADTAEALAGCGVDVTLFAGGEGVPRATHVRCLQRYAGRAQCLSRISPPFAWRWGFKNAYGWEQWSFWRGLEKELRDGGFDVLHVQDPMVAYWCNRARNKGQIRTREIFAHGTEESSAFRKRFPYVQELAPWHLEQARKALPANTIEYWAAIPNFVDTDVFHPAGSLDEKRQCRKALGIPEDAFVVGTVAALKRDHKRIDYLIEECAAACVGREELFLVLVGSKQNDTEELLALAESRMPNRVVHLVNVSRDLMPDVYRCFDVFVLASLVEMMPIALLEAMASGLPSLLNRHDVLVWMCGEQEEPEAVGGVCIDMSTPGELSRQLANAGGISSTMGDAARRRAQRLFATESVIRQYIDYYHKVMSNAC